MENNISVVINTYNAERHLQRVLDSLKTFDEIVVCDMESTDYTQEIAKSNGCKLVIFPKKDYVSAEPARTFAIQSASNPWVLVVDADEIVTPDLRDYLYNIIKTDDCPKGLYIPRKNYFMGQFMHSTYPDSQLRFFIKEGTVWPPYVHTFPTVQGNVEKISRKRIELALIHLEDDSVNGRLERINRYSENEVDKKMKKNYGFGALLYRPLFHFFKLYVIKGGFRDGKAGFINAWLDATYQIVILAKIFVRKEKR